MKAINPFYYSPVLTNLLADNYSELRSQVWQNYEADIKSSFGSLMEVMASHRPMLEYLDTVISAHEKKGAPIEVAVNDAIDELVHQFSMSDIQASRFDDVKDVARRFFSCKALVTITSNSVIVAQTLLPSDLIHMPLQYVAGFVVKEGSLTSHVALVASSLSIPYHIASEEEWNTLYKQSK